jgi:hypothetical protein
VTDPAIVKTEVVARCAYCVNGCEACAGGSVEVLDWIDAEDVKPFGRDPHQLQHPGDRR